MKKLVLVLAVLMLVAPAMATVILTCADTDCNEVTISYSVTAETELVRAFALDITVDGGKVIKSVTAFDPNYRIYPGSIDINETTGKIDNAGSPVADDTEYPGVTLGGIDTNGVTLEAGSIYAQGDDANTPGTSGVLCVVTVSGECNLSITQNSPRGGVVMEDAVAVGAFVAPGSGAAAHAVPACQACTCWGDVESTWGFGGPDGKVDTGDTNYVVSLMIAAGPGPMYTYEIPKPWPAGLECFDVQATWGFGGPDDKIDTGDLNYIVSLMIAAGPGPMYTYEIPCVTPGT